MKMARSAYRPILVGIAAPLLLTQSVRAAGGDCVPIETLFNKDILEVNSNAVNIGGYSVSGALDLWSDNPLRAGSLDGDLIGMSSGKCTLLTGANEFMCSGILKLSEKDTITYAGLSPNNDEGCKFAITGGTGCYENAQGSIVATAHGKDFLYKYEPGTSSNECVPIDQLVGDGLKEVNMGRHVAGHTLMNSKGEPIGKSFGVCTDLPDAQRLLCIGAWVLDKSGDMITFAGSTPSGTDEGIFALTGGTGCYSGSSATLSLMAANEKSTSHEWNYKAPPSADDCKSLLETLGDRTIFQDRNGGMARGDYETPGSSDHWGGNRLLSGSHHGTQRASSLGECTLLADSVEYMCLQQWIIDSDNGSTIVATGFSPNSYENGTMAISGTGCFAEIEGEMSITVQSIFEDYDFFRYEIKSTNERLKKLEGQELTW